MRITKIDLHDRNSSGGRIYENQIVNFLNDKILNDKIDFKRILLIKYSLKILNIPRILFLFLKYRYFYRGNLLLTYSTTWLAGKHARKNILIIHHLDDNDLVNWFKKFCDKFLYSNKNLYDKIITVSEYWKKELEKKGFDNIEIVYNSFNSSEYLFTQDEIIHFKEKYGLLNKPVLYIGNCQKKKGVVETYNELKDMDVQLITSGKRAIELPITNLNLDYKEYCLLLAASDIVICMSKFNEGWNRTVHEALLCGTPVIGSGTGGMEELLRMENQIICSSFSDLKKCVEETLAIKKSIKVTKLMNFDIQYFRREWERILLLED